MLWSSDSQGGTLGLTGESAGVYVGMKKTVHNL